MLAINNCHDLHCLSFSDNLIVGVIESDLAPFMTKRHDHNAVTKGAYEFNSFIVWNAHFSPKIYISKLLRIQICFCRTNYQTIFRISKYWSCQDGLNTETRENTSIYVLGRSLGFAFLPANQTYVVIKTMGPKLFLSCIFK